MANKPYRISVGRLSWEGYATGIIYDPTTGRDYATYRLTPGRERAEVAARRRSLDRHLAKPGATLGNYQW